MKPKNRIILNYLLISSLCVFAAIALVAIQNSDLTRSDHITLDSSWTMEWKKGIKENIDPGKENFLVATKGDTFVLHTVIPETEMKFPVLCAYSSYCVVTAESGGKVIYEAGRDAYESGKLSGSWINQIPLDLLSPERDITITYTVAEWNAVSSLPVHYIISATDVLSDFLRREQFSFSVSVFLLFIGLIGSITGFTSLILQKKIYPLIAISSFAFWCGMQMFCGNGYILLLSQNISLNTWLYYISMYMWPLSLLAVFYFQVAKTERGIKQAKVFTILFIAYVVLVILLQVVASIHLLVLVPVYNALVFTAVVFALVGCTRRLIQTKLQTEIVNIGFIILILYYLGDLIRSFLYYLGVNSFLGNTVSSVGVGVVIFVVSSLLTYMSWLADFTRRQSEQESWAKVIERDATTGLPSKTKSMQMLQQMHANDLEYAVVILNIDNFDDIYAQGGDEEVNAMLERYSKYVKKVFGSYGFCGRMGKSRFIVAAPEIPDAKLKQLTYVFSKYMAREKSHGTVPAIESSLGMAYSIDCENKDPLAICQLAEEHMQDIKLISSQSAGPVQELLAETTNNNPKNQ